MDNDGDFDLLTGEIVHWDVGPPSDPTELMINTGDPLVRFDRPGNDVTGLTRDHPPGWNDGDMKNGIFDFDNDGWPDVYIGSSDYPGCKALLYHQDAPLEFVQLEVEDYFLAYRAHGLAIADFDRDGDLDIMVGHSRMRCSGTGSIECNDTSQVRLLLNTITGIVPYGQSNSSTFSNVPRPITSTSTDPRNSPKPASHPPSIGSTSCNQETSPSSLAMNPSKLVAMKTETLIFVAFIIFIVALYCLTLF